MILLETPRLIIRPAVRADLADYLAYLDHPDYLRFMPTSADDLRQEIENLTDEPKTLGDASWRLAIIHKDEGKLIGDVQLSRDTYKWPGLAKIGYGVNPAYWNRNYLSEALRSVTEWAHDSLGFHRIQARCHVDNIGSWRVLEKAGYAREGITRYACYNPKDDTWDKADYVYASVRAEKVKGF